VRPMPPREAVSGVPRERPDSRRPFLVVPSLPRCGYAHLAGKDGARSMSHVMLSAT